MKILVVDDDAGVRLLLRSMLTKKFHCQVIEAKDGLEGLTLFQLESPNVVLLDVKMPIVDGVEMLEAIRSDPSHASVPVVVMSAVGDKAEVARLITFGISDYILKPLWSKSVYKRISSILAEVKAKKETARVVPAISGQAGRVRLLLVDKDRNFRTFFQASVGGQFEIHDVETGTEALEVYTAMLPTVVCLGEGLPLLNERLLARKIRQFDKTQSASIYLCVEGSSTTKSDDSLFDGVIHKSFVPDVFEKEFARTVLNQKSVHDNVLDIVNTHLNSELVTATQQTIGVMSTQEIRALTAGERESVVDDFYATVDLVEASQNFPITVGLVGSNNDVLAIAEKIIGSPVGLADGAADALGELVNTISGRIRLSFEVRGVKVEQRTPRIVPKAQLEKSLNWTLSYPFETDGGQRYIVGVAVNGK